MKIISKDLRDGEKLPERHVFNGMGYQGDNISPQFPLLILTDIIYSCYMGMDSNYKTALLQDTLSAIQAEEPNDRIVF